MTTLRWKPGSDVTLYASGQLNPGPLSAQLIMKRNLEAGAQGTPYLVAAGDLLLGFADPDGAP